MPFRFLQFKVYRDIKLLIKKIYVLSSKFPKDEQYGLVNQIRRAATSIALNLAEGSDRGSDREFSRFIATAIGSTNEVVAIIDICLDNGFFDRKNYDIIVKMAEEIVKQLSGLRKSLG